MDGKGSDMGEVQKHLLAAANSAAAVSHYVLNHTKNGVSRTANGLSNQLKVEGDYGSTAHDAPNGWRVRDAVVLAEFLVDQKSRSAQGFAEVTEVALLNSQ
jgi:hypothetical protein